MCYGYYPYTLTVLPPFKPNDYLYETHADQGRNEAEIFSWAVRDVMAKVGKLKKIECDSKIKQTYKKFITGKTDELKIDG